MRARRHHAHTSRPDRSGWWLLFVCALLMAAPAASAPLPNARSGAQVEAVFALLQNAQPAPAESRATLQVLAERAGLTADDTAQLLSSYEKWSQDQAASPASTCGTIAPSTCVVRDGSRTLLVTARERSEAPVRTHVRIRLFLE